MPVSSRANRYCNFTQKVSQTTLEKWISVVSSLLLKIRMKLVQKPFKVSHVSILVWWLEKDFLCEHLVKWALVSLLKWVFITTTCFILQQQQNGRDDSCHIIHIHMPSYTNHALYIRCSINTMACGSCYGDNFFFNEEQME